MNNPAEPMLLTVAQVCKLLNIGKTAFYSLHNSGRLGVMPVKLGGKVMYRADELRDWIKADCPPRRIWQSRKKISIPKGV